MGMAGRGGHGQERALLVLVLALAAAVVLLLLCGLTLLASLAGLAAAAPLLLLFSPVLAPSALLACLLATGAAASAALALGALSVLSRLGLAVRRAATGDRDRVEQGKRRVGELAAVAGETTPHAVLAVVGREQAATEHRKAKNYDHYVAGRMVQSA